MGTSQRRLYAEQGYLLFGDAVHEKSSRKKIALARWQYSGTMHDTVMGIVNCLYYNPDLERCWLIDAHMDQPDQDGKKEYEHLQEMIHIAILRKGLYFVLF